MERTLATPLGPPADESLAAALESIRAQQAKAFDGVQNLLGLIEKQSQSPVKDMRVSLLKALWSLQLAVKAAAEAETQEILCGYGIFSTEDAVREFSLHTPEAAPQAVAELCSRTMHEYALDALPAEVVALGSSRHRSCKPEAAGNDPPESPGGAGTPENGMAQSVSSLWQEIKKYAPNATDSEKIKLRDQALAAIGEYAFFWCLFSIFDAKLPDAGKKTPKQLPQGMPQRTLQDLRARNACSPEDINALANVEKTQAKKMAMACVIPAIEIFWPQPTAAKPPSLQERTCTSRWIKAE